MLNRIAAIINAAGDQIPVSLSAGVVRDGGEVIGGVEVLRNISSIDEVRKAVSRQYRCEDILSVNSRMRRIFEMLPAVSESLSTVLIVGETGTGKEKLARAIHNLSLRADGPFVAVNCGALPDNLLESELFGYKKGAFTGAVGDKPGRFRIASGGTIFLDEIGDISPALQVRLLRVLQEKEFEPLGGVATEKADVRVVAATNRDLEKLVAEGRFRKDLYYRLNIIRIELPSLSERKEDVPLLADHFVEQFNREQGRNLRLGREAVRALMLRDYPGNIRELQNIVERAFVLCQGGEIRAADLAGVGDSGQAAVDAGSSIRDMESALILDTLRKNDWNKARTARELGIHKTTLYRKIRQLGIEDHRR